MELHTPQYREMMGKLSSGELTRAQASEQYGVKSGTLNAWLSRAKIKTPRAKTGVMPPASAARVATLQSDPDKVSALNAAVQKILAGEITAYRAAKADPRLSEATLNLWVRNEREKLGLAPRPRGRPSPTNPADAVEAVRLARIALAKAEADLEVFLSATN